MLNGQIVKAATDRLGTVGRRGDLGIFTDAYGEGDMMLFQPAKPLLANKFAITDQGLNPGGWKHGQHPFYQGDAFGGIRVAFFVQQRPEKRKGHALVDQTH